MDIRQPSTIRYLIFQPAIHKGFAMHFLKRGIRYPEKLLADGSPFGPLLTNIIFSGGDSM